MVDDLTGDSIQSATVYLPEFSLYCFTDELGEFYFDQLPINSQITDSILLEISHLAYKKKQINIALPIKHDSVYTVFLVPKNINMSEITVTELKEMKEMDELMAKLKKIEKDELQKKFSSSISEIVNGELGVSSTNMGPATGRPVIRGMTGTKVQINKDGEPINDLSATSADHAVATDPFGIDNIELITGPKTLLYSGSTVGGIINLGRGGLLQRRNNELELQILSQTMNMGYSGSASGNYNLNNFSVFGKVSGQQTDELKAPEKTLQNTAIESSTLEGGSAYKGEVFSIGGEISQYISNYGIPGGFVGAHPNGVDIEMLRRVYRAEARIMTNALLQNIDVDFSRTYYGHTEYESDDLVGAEFVFSDYNARLNFNFGESRLLDSAIIGAFYNFRDFDIGGFVFSPPTIKNSISSYLYSEKHFDRIEAQVSLRHEYVNFDPINNINSSIGNISDREFSIFAYSASIHYHFSGKFSTAFTFSKSARAPTIEELYSEGPHLAAYSYEIGNPELESESGHITELSVFYSNKKLFASATIFYNMMHNYITPRQTGDTNWATLLPIFQTSAGAAVLAGFESKIEYFITNHITIRNLLSYVQGEFSNDNPLPMIPPLNGSFSISYSNSNFSFGANTIYAAEQNRTDLFEERTPGYLIFGLNGMYMFELYGIRTSINLNIDNITNQTYYNHLSRIRSIMPEPGINLRFNLRILI